MIPRSRFRAVPIPAVTVPREAVGQRKIGDVPAGHSAALVSHVQQVLRLRPVDDVAHPEPPAAVRLRSPGIDRL
ncbi:hypothetical protein QM588_22750 [Rhodococcus sp. IEGM 1354]|uniref:hypothetical protein n=1 Tax=Rhodococcus sp. IEGM 1354 TaxID=3047088 RepID=UPI0024B6A115|nr:hypothetical protein [Rhodococcus sp. IEGM 1354]MDI9933245.1 hypothetical protein [Rhodococcus sp. IEGM 1354]